MQCGGTATSSIHGEGGQPKRGKVVAGASEGDPVHALGRTGRKHLKLMAYDVVHLGLKGYRRRPCPGSQDAHSRRRLECPGAGEERAKPMVITANDLKDAGLDFPMQVGGAALGKVPHRRDAPSYGKAVCCYAQDAMTGTAA